MFNLEEEYKSFNIPDDHWVISPSNISWGICKTYPRLLILPKKFDTTKVMGVCNFRSNITKLLSLIFKVEEDYQY